MKIIFWGSSVHLLDKMISESEFVGLRWTCGVRHNTEQNSLLLAVRKGSSSSAVAHDFCVLSPGGSPCPPVTQAGSAGAVPAQNMPLAQGWCAVLLLCLGCSLAAIVSAQRRGELWTWPAEREPIQALLCQRPLERRQYVRHMVETCCAPAILG